MFFYIQKKTGTSTACPSPHLWTVLYGAQLVRAQQCYYYNSPPICTYRPPLYTYIYILLYNHLHILYIYHIYSYSYVSSSSSIAPLGGQAAVACRMCWCGGACPLFLYYLSAPPAAAAATVPCKACFDQIFCFLRNIFV